MSFSLPIIKCALYICSVVAVAALYFIFGKIGLLLSVPPGYATIIWPPSGLSVAAVFIFGRKIFPGIFFGSFILNAYLSHNQSFDFDEMSLGAMVVPAAIAVGSTLQAVVAEIVIVRLFGRPIKLATWKNVVYLMLVIVPLCSLLACSIGVSALFYHDIVPASRFWENWATWWFGDFLGVIIFAPAIIVVPVFKHVVLWHGQKISNIAMLSIYAVFVPLGLTFYAWKASSQFIYEKNKQAFESLTAESEEALLYRVHSYELALKGARGFFQGSSFVSPQEWKDYVRAINVESNYPGINGIGFIKLVKDTEINEYEKIQREQGLEGFTVHSPEKSYSKDRFVITYIAPENKNREAIGLDISFESRRAVAAELSRDTGLAAITKTIALVQDEQKGAGFLLLLPHYNKDEVIETIGQRKNALFGWIYAPFIASKFMNNLTTAQGRYLHLRVYDGESVNDTDLIYDSNKFRQTALAPTYSVRKTVYVEQNNWTIIWDSTPAFEESIKSYEPTLILLGGGVITFMFAGFLCFVSRRSYGIQRQVEGKLKKSEESYELAVKGMSVGLWDWDIATGTVFWSDQYRKIIGLKDADFQATIDSFKSRIHPDDIVRLNESIDSHFYDHTHHDIEFRMRHEDGHFIWVHGSGQAVWDENGQPLRMSGSIADISSRKYAEQALIRSEELNTLAVRGMSVGLWDWDMITGEITTSFKLQEIIGFGLGAQLNGHLGDLIQRIHPDDIDRVMSTFKAHLNERKSFEIEARVKGDDGKYIWLQGSGQAKWDENGVPVRMVGSIANIDSRKMAEEKLVQSNAELERFAYIASHDLQEPLRMVRNFTQILDEEYGGKLDKQAKEYMGFIIGGASRMQYLVSDLLEYSRADKENIDMQHVECDSVMRAVEDNLKQAILESGARVYYDNLPVVWANPIQLMRLLQNLVGNALKYRRAGVKPDILVDVVDGADGSLFSVTDNGIGIKEEYLDQVFVLFKRLHRDSEYEGTGIGLSICKKIVESMGGEIWVESEYGQGSTFYFTLPKE